MTRLKKRKPDIENERPDARSTATRQRLVDAAIDLFGKFGYDATSTRALTEAADANLSAIPYYFSTKRALHLAAAQHIADMIARTVGPVMETFENEIYDEGLTRTRAIALLQEIFTPYIAMLTSEQSSKWAQFVLREQASPSQAFDIIYEHGGARFVRAVTHLTAIATGDEPGSKRAQLRALTLVGQALVFRTARALTLRTLGTDRLNQTDIALATTLIRENIRLLGSL
ncbi:MAG: CerR family C-terminal domain-containing protein [Alphaproteobacteria bacterium]|nr:CerR family C-terminal domain-containing protein [Alphaproteobacteria bacterium]